MRLFALLALVLQTPVWANQDPFYPRQWSLENDGTQTVTIEQDPLHSTEQRGVAGVDIGWRAAQILLARMKLAPVTVAVLDSGIDVTHPDFKGRIAEGAKDLLTDATVMTDPVGRGTHVAGVLAAAFGNTIGIAGVAPLSVKILPIRVLSDEFKNFTYKGKLISDYVADGIRYALSRKVQVINLSFGWPKAVDTENARQALREAVQAGVLVVAAAGNDRNNEPSSPCASEGVLCVGAVTNTGDLARYSNRGGMIDVIAPGDGIISLYPLNLESKILRVPGYELMSGSSQAAPMIAGIAAALKSAQPAISLSELKARILASARAIPSQTASLFGLPDMTRAVQLTPLPVFLPKFKPTAEVITEAGVASGTLSVQSLWASAFAMTATLTINGKPGKPMTQDRVAGGSELQLPWSYAFSGPDDDSSLKVELELRYRAREGGPFLTQKHSADLVAVRPANPGIDVRVIEAPGALASEWLGTNYGHVFSKLRPVEAYGLQLELPAYYRQTASDPKQSVVELFDAANPKTIVSVEVPRVHQISQVLRLDANLDGKPDWVITGILTKQGKSHLQFYFLSSDFKPLWGKSSARAIALDGDFGKLILRDYSQPGSWLRKKDMLVPSFLAMGMLRSAKAESHIYYLNPKKRDQYELRELEMAGVRGAKAFKLENLLPQPLNVAAQGHLRALLTTGEALAAPALLWDIRGVDDSELIPLSGWDALSASGQVLQALPGTQNLLLNFYDSARGSVAWTTPEGKWLGRSEFQYVSPGDGLSRLVGATVTPSGDHVLFFESRFDLVAIRESNGAQVQQTLPIQRDSSFVGAQFSELLSPLLVGSLHGVYADSTWVVGDRVSVVAWNESKKALVRPLRYSLQIPAGCAQMPQVSLADPSALQIPVLCPRAEGVELRLLSP